MSLHRPHSFILDAEALSALAVNSRAMQAWATLVHRTDSTLHASTLTLAEVTDGGARDAGVRRVVKALHLHPVTEEVGYLAGRLRAAAATSRRKPRDLTVDAVVAATALELTGPAVVFTSDPGDLRALLADTPVRVEALG